VSVEDRERMAPIADLRAITVQGKRFLSIEPLLEDLGEIGLDGIDWVIVGGESGIGARPMREEWAQSILPQCRERNIPFFFKQWSAEREHGGRVLNGREYNEFPGGFSAHTFRQQDHPPLAVDHQPGAEEQPARERPRRFRHTAGVEELVEVWKEPFPDPVVSSWRTPTIQSSRRHGRTFRPSNGYMMRSSSIRAE
jgi:hypothetical protein